MELLSPEGVLTPHPDYPIEVTADLLKGLYRDMVLVRRFDREANALQRQGQLSIWVPLLGQEAAQIGAGRALEPQDMAFPVLPRARRGLVPRRRPDRTARHLPGHRPLRLESEGKRFHAYTIVIGNQVLNATGYAMGQKFDGVIGRSRSRAARAARDEATIVFFGDGATSQGDVHEGMVFAAAYDAPIVFYCQNNQWAISEPVERQTRVPLFHRSRGYGFPGIRVDGNDVLACLAVTRWALRRVPVAATGRCSSRRSPTGWTRTPPPTTRPGTGWPTRREAWKLLDPIERVRVHLVRGAAGRPGLLRRGRRRGGRAGRAGSAPSAWRCPSRRWTGCSTTSTPTPMPRPSGSGPS